VPPKNLVFKKTLKQIESLDLQELRTFLNNHLKCKTNNILPEKSLVIMVLSLISVALTTPLM
jgi:hypothetical protein